MVAADPAWRRIRRAESSRCVRADRPVSQYRAENSHQPTRQRERAMKRFKSSRHAQRFLSAFSGISAHFRPRRHLLSATEWRTEMADRFAVWRQVTAPDAAA